MNIAIILDKSPSLSETFIMNHITRLIDRGHKINIFARYTQKETKIHSDIEQYKLFEKTCYLPYQERGLNQVLKLAQNIKIMRKFPIFRYCLNPFRYGLGVFRLRAFYGLNDFINKNFDILHCHYGFIGWAFLCIKDVIRAPFVTSFHGQDLTRFGYLGPVLYSQLFKKGDAFVANSKHTYKMLLKLGCPKNKIYNIPALISDRNIKSAKKIFSEDKVKILTVSRLDDGKGVQYCLGAVKMLKDKGYKIFYNVVGDGPYKRQLISLAHEMKIQNIVHFIGWQEQNEVFEHYKNSDIFVLPSVVRKKDKWVETQGVVIQEAQLHGLPVIGSNIGGIPESLNYGEAGLLFKPGCVKDLAYKLQRLIDNRPYARNLAKAGIEYCNNKYSTNSILPKYEELYMKLQKKNN